MQRFSFQQGANHPHGKPVASPNGVDNVVDFYRGNCALFTVCGFKPRAVGTRFQHHGLHAVAEIEIRNPFRRLLSG